MHDQVQISEHIHKLTLSDQNVLFMPWLQFRLLCAFDPEGPMCKDSTAFCSAQII